VKLVLDVVSSVSNVECKHEWLLFSRVHVSATGPVCVPGRQARPSTGYIMCRDINQSYIITIYDGAPVSRLVIAPCHHNDKFYSFFGAFQPPTLPLASLGLGLGGQTGESWWKLYRDSIYKLSRKKNLKIETKSFKIKFYKQVLNKLQLFLLPQFS